MYTLAWYTQLQHTAAGRTYSYVAQLGMQQLEQLGGLTVAQTETSEPRHTRGVFRGVRLTLLLCTPQVHDDWLSAVAEGRMTGPHLPHIPQEEVHWLLQPSCESVLPQPWQRVRLICLRKPSHPSNSSRCVCMPAMHMHVTCTCMLLAYVTCGWLALIVHIP